jgi:peptide/nickel transport system substrate-binding protein
MERVMKGDLRRWALAAAATLMIAAGAMSGAYGKTFKWANAGDVSSMDPYYRNETFLLAFMENIYEPLVRRDRNLGLEPALAVKWGQTSPTTWFFDLRPGVKFHDGTPFTADDVVFSLDRANSGGSNMKSYFTSVKAVRKVNDLRIEVETKYPDPLLASKWASNILIMSRAWTEKNNAAVAADATKNEENFATRNAMGTGPFMLRERRAGEKTVLTPNPHWWDKQVHNLTEVIFMPVPNPATRVAALRSGDIDMIYEVPPQDVESLARDPNVKVIEGPEIRVVFLGFDQERDELVASSVKGRNPFKDRRVREAIYRSIDVNAIRRVVMRGHAYPAALLVTAGINGYVEALDKRPPLLQPAEAKKLLADAGYPDGFEVRLDCPNDRYVNDEKICQAVVSMLARIGIKVNLAAQTRSLFFARLVRKPDNSPGDVSFFLLAWSPSITYDVHNVFEALLHTPDKQTGKGAFNMGGYSNKALDQLIDRIEQETDKAKRDAMIVEATRIYTEDFAYVPLHQQAVIWAARKNIELFQPADNRFPLRFVVVK